MKNRDKFRGCLIGGAVGDALGYPVEFQREPSIFQEYGKQGITEYNLLYDKAIITDDTQMTLFTANGLLSAAAKSIINGIEPMYADEIKEMYLKWYITQYYSYPLFGENKKSWLLNVPELFSRRAPGITCLNALSQGGTGTIENPLNNSKGCGGVMRVAPIGLYFCGKDNSYEESDMLGAKASAVTHGHDLGYIPSAAFVHIIRKITEDENISLKDAVIDSISATARLFSDAKHISDFTELMNNAVELSGSDADDLDAIHMLGEGWVAEEALAVAVYCALKYPNDFERAVIASVNHNGDSDSTGAILGNILGAYLGYEAIPEKFKKNLEISDVILEVADDLYDDFPASEELIREGSVWYDKYVNFTYSVR